MALKAKDTQIIKQNIILLNRNINTDYFDGGNHMLTHICFLRFLYRVRDEVSSYSNLDSALKIRKKESDENTNKTTEYRTVIKTQTPHKATLFLNHCNLLNHHLFFPQRIIHRIHYPSYPATNNENPTMLKTS